MKKHHIHFKPKALKDLRAIQRAEQGRILEKIELLTENLQGDVKKLTVLPYEEFKQIQEALEDLQTLREDKATAIDEPTIPLEEVRSRLGL